MRQFGRPFKAFIGYMYHFIRYCKYSGWREDVHDPSKRNYLVAKIYHSLEKSLSFNSRRKGAGYNNALILSELINDTPVGEPRGFHDLVAPQVLKMFIDSDDGLKGLALPINVVVSDGELGGVLLKTNRQLSEGVLNSPEMFFLSRHSLREFDRAPVSFDLIYRSIELAMKTPSACNRQPWHVYHLSGEERIRAVLALQNGNRGFGDNVANLLIITADIHAFGPAAEHYQHWIDGGMFSMSIIYSLHSLGVASCCLNWSASPTQDLALRRTVSIKDHHSVIMMLAFGWPDELNKVCQSPRRPISEVLTSLDAA